MKLKAINAIYRKEKGKQVIVPPGTEFDCPEDEAKRYLDLKAATAVDTEKAPAKKAPAKKAPTKKAEETSDKEPAVDPLA